MILVTGANGFVGNALCRTLVREGYAVRCAVRQTRSVPADNMALTRVGDIDETTEWAPALAGVRCVVHLAARTHAMDSLGLQALEQYRRINVGGTRRLAESAAQAGVERMVFLSSVKVNGESTAARPYTEKDTPHPQDAYGITKWEAEQTLRHIAKERGLEIVILRPPLIYGPGVKGNFLRLMRLVDRGIPLPFASVANRRSLVFLGNLVTAIVLCMRSAAAPGHTYLVSDGEDLSTPELVRRVAMAMDRRLRLVPFPVSVLSLAGRLLGRHAEIARLTGSLQVDSAALRDELGWRPQFSLAAGLRDTARWYREACVS